MVDALSPKRRSNVEIIYGTLSLCSRDGMTRTNIKAQVRLGNSQADRIIELLSSSEMTRRDENGYFHLTAPGHDVMRRLMRPIWTIKRIEQMLETGSDATTSAEPMVRGSQSRFNDDSSMLTVSQVARRLHVHQHSVRR